jgi:hypothetical protein
VVAQAAAEDVSDCYWVSGKIDKCSQHPVLLLLLFSEETRIGFVQFRVSKLGAAGTHGV